MSNADALTRCQNEPMPLSMSDAVESVLRAHSKGAPMHYRRITELAIEEGLIEPQGLTPEASVNAALTQDIKRRKTAEREQRFRAHGRGMYGLATPVDLLGGALTENNQRVRSRLREILSETDPQQFEILIGELLIALGFEDVEVTRYSGDGGIDVRANLSVGGVTAAEVGAADQSQAELLGSIIEERAVEAEVKRIRITGEIGGE